MSPFKPATALASVLAAVLAACGGDHAVPPPAAPDALKAPPRPFDGEWKTWSHEQKLAYMKSAVLPAEAALFRTYSARFADFTCRTCHGAGADDGSYKMPNPALPTLVPGHIHDLEKTLPEGFRFMNDIVMPRTAALLGLPEFQHETMRGFGCLACHTRAAERDAPVGVTR